MIYVTSDLHGVPLRRFLDLLQKAGFTEDDTLFVLGDSIDRGDHGVELLLWAMNQYNVIHLLGNHEAMLRSVMDTLLETITDDSLQSFTAEKWEIISNMLANGAQPTLTALKRLVKERPEMIELLQEYLDDMPMYDSVEVEDRVYVFVHAGLGGFAPERSLSSYTADELLWHRPELTERYFGGDVMVVFGHTPTSYYESAGSIVKTDSWCCIDTSDTALTLLRLDDWTVFQESRADTH